MTTTFSSSRALVLGGGGAVGNAWLIGVLAGLADGGLDVTNADLVIGTSAGATAAVQVTNEPLPELYATVLESVPPQRPDRPAGSRGPVGSQADHLERTQRIIDSASDAADMRRRMGAAFHELDAASGGAGTDRWRSTVAARMAGSRWPAQRLLLTAVDAHTGEGVAFDRDSGVDLVDAVAASTSGGSAYRIGDRQYIDGGYRRNENADLAAGSERVLILSPFAGRTRHPLEWGMQLAAQVDELRAAGSRVETVFPDEAALEAFGDTMLDLARRAPAARAGFEQGRSRAEVLIGFWR
ncbi:patatin-like phospholipase family protein [uncultured Amnibacterium sp.]|uniref:patatin-like phospholipase family protein n=1 Tax=uncultured Amnibacterium sp. TaxID=1631851 RepID=UPI0035CB71FA